MRIQIDFGISASIEEKVDCKTEHPESVAVSMHHDK